MYSPGPQNLHRFTVRSRHPIRNPLHDVLILQSVITKSRLSFPANASSPVRKSHPVTVKLLQNLVWSPSCPPSMVTFFTVPKEEYRQLMAQFAEFLMVSPVRIIFLQLISLMQ